MVKALAYTDGRDGAFAPSSFICSSDRLFFDRPILPLPPDKLHHPGLVYFVLSKSMLRQNLSMADLAVLAGRLCPGLLLTP